MTPVFRVAALLCFFVSATVPSLLLALSLDDFQGRQEARALTTNDPDSALLKNLSGTVGGSRFILVNKTSNDLSGKVDSYTNAGIYSHSQDTGAVGYSEIAWDGRSSGRGINPTGLGGIDLTQDASDAFVLKIYFNDLGLGNQTNLVMVVYDAGDPTGSTLAEYTLILKEQVCPPSFPDCPAGSVPPTEYEIPFADFVGSVDFSNIGAIKLMIDGSNPGLDIAFQYLKTNGTCDRVPVAGKSVFDQCGVCGGDNTTCLDCEKVPNGPAVPGTTCTSKLPGACEEGQYSDECFCLSVNDPSPETCDGIDNDCDGDIDENYPLVGQPCQAGEDECSVDGMYICNNQGGVKCDAEIDFDFQFEQCDEEIGCDGVPGSGLQQDDCGVCGGDGSLCDGCTSEDKTIELFRLDAGAKAQEKHLIAITKTLKRKARGTEARPRILRYIRRARDRANQLQIATWILSWTLPAIITDCPEALDNCVRVSTSDTTRNYNANNFELFKLSKRTVRKLRRFGVKKSSLRKARRTARKLYQENFDRADTFPDASSQCY